MGSMLGVYPHVNAIVLAMESAELVRIIGTLHLKHNKHKHIQFVRFFLQPKYYKVLDVPFHRAV
jgi:hypothetical protein